MARDGYDTITVPVETTAKVDQILKILEDENQKKVVHGNGKVTRPYVIEMLADDYLNRHKGVGGEKTI